MSVVLFAPAACPERVALVSALETAVGPVQIALQVPEAVGAWAQAPRSVLLLDLRGGGPEHARQARAVARACLRARSMALLPLDLRGAPEADVVLRPPIYLDEVVRWCIRASRGPMAEEILEDMAAGLSHEIGNPLTSLFLQIDMLKADSGLDTVPDQLDLAEHLGLIEESARRIEAVVRDVASAAVRQPVRADATALGEFLEETLRCLAERSPGFEARVDVTCSDEDILVDRVLLRGALADVWEYMLRAGEPDERLVIDAASLASGSLRIDALSRTTRLPSDAADRLFTPLWARQALGLPEGISLTSARNAFRRHGGELRARSAGEELLCVEALLPASEAADPTRAGSES